MIHQAIEELNKSVVIRPRYDNFIGGEWVPPARGQYFTNLTPVSGQPLCEVARSTAEDIEKALDAAHAAIMQINTLDARRSGSFSEEEASTLPLGGTTLTRTFDELALQLAGVAASPQTIGNGTGPGVGAGVGRQGNLRLTDCAPEAIILRLMALTTTTKTSASAGRGFSPSCRSRLSRSKSIRQSRFWHRHSLGETLARK